MISPSTQNGKWKLFLLGFGVFLLSFIITFILFGGVRKASQFFKNHHFWSSEKKVPPIKKETPKLSPVTPPSANTITPEIEAIVQKYQNVLDLNASAEWKGYPLEIRKKAYEVMQERKKKEILAPRTSGSSEAEKKTEETKTQTPAATPLQTPVKDTVKPLDTLLQGKQ